MDQHDIHPLDYEEPPKPSKGLVILSIIGMVVYLSGLGACVIIWKGSWGAIASAAETWTIIFGGLIAIPFGIKYGTQDKKFWT